MNLTLPEFGQSEFHSLSVVVVAEELAINDFDEDRHGIWKFYGSIHDIEIGNAGELRCASVYSLGNLMEVLRRFKVKLEVLRRFSGGSPEVRHDNYESRGQSGGRAEGLGSALGVRSECIRRLSGGDLRRHSGRFTRDCEMCLRIIGAEFKTNPSASAVIDCTGKLVRDIGISNASDMAKRSREARAKKPKKLSTDGRRVLYEVLNFHLVLKLECGLFVGLETVVVDRASPIFINILQKLKRSLVEYGNDADNIRYFVCDMSGPFSIAIVMVFNRLHLPEYMAYMLYSAKLGDTKIRETHTRTVLSWSGVHGDRAFRNFCRDKFNGLEEILQASLILVLRNIRLALLSTKSYEELCAFVGFLDLLASKESFPACCHETDSDVSEQKTAKELVEHGEALTWTHLAGVPAGNGSEFLPKVMIRACSLKGYNPSHFEQAYEDYQVHGQGNENDEDEEEFNLRLEEQEQEKESFVGEHGVRTVTYGHFTALWFQNFDDNFGAK